MRIQKVNRKFIVVQDDSKGTRIIKTFNRLCDAKKFLTGLKNRAFQGSVPSFMLEPGYLS